MALLRKARILRDDGHPVARPFLATIAVTWLPLMLLAPVSRGGVSFATDLSVHARFLLAIPLLLEADVRLHRLSAVAIGRFAEGRLAAAANLDPGSVEEIQRRAERLRRSAGGELVCLLIALLVGQLNLWGKGENPLSFQGFATPTLSAATLWYGCVALPVFLFLVYRSLWGWLIWSWVLWRFSRMELRLVPTHPDLSGGLSVLAIPIHGFALILLAVGVGVAGAWGTQIVFRGAALSAFAGPLGLLVAMALLLGLGPLLAFSGKLFRARVLGRVQYGELARVYTTEFDERWIVGRQKEGLLGTPDIQSLADLANSYELVRRMHIAPFDKYDVLLLVVVLLLPMCPLVLTVISFKSLLRMLAHTLF